MFQVPPFPIVERVEIVPRDDAETAARDGKPLLTDQYGDWFAMRYEAVSGSGNVVTRLRLAIPIGGLPPAVEERLPIKWLAAAPTR